MQAELDQLRESTETLKRLLSAREAELAQRQAQIAQRDGQLAAARGELLVTTTLIEKLKVEIARLKRMQFGRSSEKTTERIAQLEPEVKDSGIRGQAQYSLKLRFRHRQAALTELRRRGAEDHRGLVVGPCGGI